MDVFVLWKFIRLYFHMPLKSTVALVYLFFILSLNCAVSSLWFVKKAESGKEKLSPEKWDDQNFKFFSVLPW